MLGENLTLQYSSNFTYVNTDINHKNKGDLGDSILMIGTENGVDQEGNSVILNNLVNNFEHKVIVDFNSTYYNKYARKVLDNNSKIKISRVDVSGYYTSSEMTDKERHDLATRSLEHFLINTENAYPSLCFILVDEENVADMDFLTSALDRIYDIKNSQRVEGTLDGYLSIKLILSGLEKYISTSLLETIKSSHELGLVVLGITSSYELLLKKTVDPAFHFGHLAIKPPVDVVSMALMLSHLDGVYDGDTLRKLTTEGSGVLVKNNTI